MDSIARLGSHRAAIGLISGALSAMCGYIQDGAFTRTQEIQPVVPEMVIEQVNHYIPIMWSAVPAPPAIFQQNDTTTLPPVTHAPEGNGDFLLISILINLLVGLGATAFFATRCYRESFFPCITKHEDEKFMPAGSKTKQTMPIRLHSLSSVMTPAESLTEAGASRSATEESTGDESALAKPAHPDSKSPISADATDVLQSDCREDAQHQEFPAEFSGPSQP